MDIRTIQFGSDDYITECRLRDRYLRRPLGLVLDEQDTAGEDGFVHLGIFDTAELIGCVIIMPLDGQTCRLKQMLVIPEYQGNGAGSSLLNAAEDHCWRTGADRIILHARDVASGFYKRHGYRIISDSFEEVGIPHFRMEKLKRDGT